MAATQVARGAPCLCDNAAAGPTAQHSGDSRVARRQHVRRLGCQIAPRFARQAARSFARQFAPQFAAEFAAEFAAQFAPEFVRYFAPTRAPVLFLAHRRSRP